MVHLELKIPTLVQHIQVDGKPYFNLSPLFLRGPVATHRRYQEAIANYRQEIRRNMADFKLNRNNSEDFFWLFFHPTVYFQKQRLIFSMGRDVVDGLFSTVEFSVNKMQVLLLPGFGNSMQILDVNEGSLDSVALERLIRRRLTQEREVHGSYFSPEEYYATPRDFIAEIPVKLELQFSPIAIGQPEAEHYFFRKNDELEFDGASELYKIGSNLNELYPQELQRAFFQEKMVEELASVLFHQQEIIPIAIVGKEGIGRHTVIHEALALYLEELGKKDNQERPTNIWQIDPTRIVSGMSIVGQWQKRLEAIIKYVISEEDPKDIPDKLLTDNPVALLRVGRSGQNEMTASDVLKPYLEKRLLQLILIATPEEWLLLQEKDRAFSSLFQVIRMKEPDFHTSIKIILEQRKRLELEHSTKISITAIEQLLYTHRVYQADKALPGGLVRLLRQLAIKHRFGYIGAAEAREEFGLITGLRERFFDPSYVFEPDEVKNSIARELIGQEDAAEALSNVVHLFKAKLNNNRRPISSLLFVGPTGVGKTHAAKVLTRYLTGNEGYLLRFDMNEYLDPYAVDRLIGDEYNPEGQLTGKVRYQPFSVILLDEIEKAHRKVQDLLLQLLDDGRLTDRLGRTVDFTNAIIIMTSNAGAEDIDRQITIGRNRSANVDIYRSALERQFRPEFINRIDQVVVFKPLAEEHLLGIAQLQIDELLQRDGFVRRSTILNITREALEWVAKRGYDPKMGGRALRRQIDRDLTYLLAEQLLKIQADSPIILDIRYQDERLVPEIHPLEFVAANDATYYPELPRYEEGKNFYDRLLLSTEQMIEDIQNREVNPYEDWDVDNNWLYYDFITQLDETKEKLLMMMNGFNNPQFRQILPTPLRLKKCDILTKRDKEKGTRSLEEVKARLFQEAALNEISDSYQYAETLFDGLRTEFIGHFLNVALLRLYGQAFLKGQLDEIVISIDSLITGQGAAEAQSLLLQYQSLLEHLNVSYSIDEETHKITAEGYGIATLFQGEAGIHLFYIGHQSPLPIRVKIRPWHKETAQQWQVIRLYDGKKTITDLRTRFMNAFNLTPPEFKLILYAGLPQDIRSAIAP